MNCPLMMPHTLFISSHFTMIDPRSFPFSFSGSVVDVFLCTSSERTVEASPMKSCRSRTIYRMLIYNSPNRLHIRILIRIIYEELKTLDGLESIVQKNTRYEDRATRHRIHTSALQVVYDDLGSSQLLPLSIFVLFHGDHEGITQTHHIHIGQILAFEG